MVEKRNLKDYTFSIEDEIIKTLFHMREWFTTKQFIDRYREITHCHPKTAQRKLKWALDNELIIKVDRGEYNKIIYI